MPSLPKCVQFEGTLQGRMSLSCAVHAEAVSGQCDQRAKLVQAAAQAAPNVLKEAAGDALELCMYRWMSLLEVRGAVQTCLHTGIR